MDERLLTLSGKEIAGMIRRGDISSREAVATHIAHMQRVNTDLNAVVADRYEQAMKEAAKADRERAKKPLDELPEYHGVPCSIKECFALKGMPNTSGLVSRRGITSKSDATAVKRMRAAGVIPLGVTNTSELCMWMESNNRVYGRTNNPYDPSRIVGGSSGGEGAIIGSGASPFGLGSDVGGSIRMPAFFNGVFGHKPTGGMVPATGQFPTAENDALRYLTTGPLTRRAEDLMPLLRIMAGPDGKDKECSPWELGDPAGVRIDELTVLDVPENGWLKVSDELKAAQRRAARALEDMGATVREVRFARLKRSLDIWSSMLQAADGTPFAEMLEHRSPLHTMMEFGRWAMRRSPHTLPAILLALLEKATALTPGRTRRFVEEGLKLRAELIESIGPKGVMLYPSYPEVAPTHYKPMLPPFNWVYTAILNVMELPVTQVPLGLDHQGLPLGVQVAGIPGNDHVTIAVAVALEKAFGGWVPPARIFGNGVGRASGAALTA